MWDKYNTHMTIITFYNFLNWLGGEREIKDIVLDVHDLNQVLDTIHISFHFCIHSAHTRITRLYVCIIKFVISDFHVINKDGPQ